MTDEWPISGDVMEMVYKEISRAKEKFPKWPVDIMHAAGVVAEESGELTKAALDHTYGDGLLKDACTEAVHTAATAMRFVEELLRRGYEKRPEQR